MVTMIYEFREHGNAIEHLGSGWSSSETEHTWMIGFESFVSIPSEDSDADLLVDMVLMPHVRDEILRRQRLIVSANNTIIQCLEFSTSEISTVSFVIPKKLLNDSGFVTLRFIHPDAASPMELTNTPDNRQLAIAVLRLAITQNNMKATSTVAISSDTTSRPSQGERRVYAFGAYGTNNTGDEAIFQGLRTIYPNATQIYINKSHNSEGIWYADLLDGSTKLEHGCLGIIGGGGLFHSESTINEYLQFAEIVLAAEGTVEIRAVGAEAAEPTMFHTIRALAARCHRITVRTTESQRIMEALLGRPVELEPDFALRLTPSLLVRNFYFPSSTRPIVGIATGMNPFQSRGDVFIDIIKRYTENPYFNFLLIPHSRSYVDPFNNDLITFEYLWSSVDIYHASRETRIKIASFSNNTDELLSTYASIDGIIGERFHSLVFAHLYDLPTLAFCEGRKNRSFVADCRRSGLLSVDNSSNLDELLSSFFSLVDARHSSR